MGLPPSRDDIVTSHEILNDHGLAVPNRPVEWGGLARRVGRKGLVPTQHQIWLDETQLASVPEPLNFTKMVGPVIAVIIGIILAASIGLGFVNEYRAERATEALHSRVRHTAMVRRDGSSSRSTSTSWCRAT